MGRFKTLTILLTLGAWGAATEGSLAFGQAPVQPAGSARKQPPAPPSEYVRAGVQLYTMGQVDKAAQYFKAASDYRDQLTPADCSQLDSYLARMGGPTVDAAVTPASASVPAAAPTPAPAGEANPAARPEGGPRGGSTDAKQQARWFLQSAREQGRLGHYDEAEALVAKADGMGIKWGLFDDTPAKVREAIAKVRPKLALSATPSEAAPTRDHKSAKNRLLEGRQALKSNQFEQAEAIALEVNSWGLSYSVFEDSPTKLASAARALRNRDKLRGVPAKDLPSQGAYDVLVLESRTLLNQGKYDQAEAKARNASRLNVVPSLTADRAESVLHDIAMAKARTAGGSPTAAGEPASQKAEREANDLLAKNDSKAALVKFTEAEQARLRETNALDPAVRQVSADTPAPADAPAMVEALPAPAPMPAPAEGLLLGDIPAAAPAPLDAPAPAPTAGQTAEEAAKFERGESLMNGAKAMFTRGNYPAARQMATEAKEAGVGVDAQADELLAAIGLSEQGGALSVYEAALASMRKGDNDRAKGLLTELQGTSAPIDDSMRGKIDALLAKLGMADGGAAGKAVASDGINDAQAIEAQKLNAEVGTKVAEARRMLEVDPDKAISLLNDALAAVKAKDLPPTVSRTMTRRLDVAIELAKKEKATFDVRMQDKTVRAENEAKKLRILEADKAKKSQIDALMKQAEAAYANQNLAEAEMLAKRAQAIDPNELAPGMLVYKANLERHYKQSVSDKKAKDESVLAMLHDVDKSNIVDPEVIANSISMPKGFSDLTRERLAMNARLETKRPARTLEIEAKLKEQVSLNMKNMTLAEATTYIQNYTGLNVILDQKGLQDEGLTSDSKVDINVNKMKLETALKYLLKPLGLVFRVDDEVVLITSPQATKESTFNVTYPVGDLVIGPDRNPVASSASAARALMGDAAGAPDLMNSGVPSSVASNRPKVDMTPLIKLITETVAPGTWNVGNEKGEMNGGDGAYGQGGGLGFGGDALGATGPPIGSIIPFTLSISLIIRHTAEVHEDVADLLRQLRRLQDLQVSIEVRFINVTDDFFEQIGVDFNFNIQSDVVGKKTTFAVPNPANALFPSANTGGIGGGGTSTTTTGAGTTTGGTTGGGGIGGTGGVAGGGGATTGLGGNTGGGTTTAGGTTGATPAYLVNPVRDHSLGNRLPLTVGLAGTSNNGNLPPFTGDLGIPFIQSSAAQIAPFNAVPGVGSTFGISFLSDLEVYLFLTAAQGDTRSNIVQAPKITTFNGASAFISNTQNRYYIQSLIPVVGFGAVAFTPTPAPLQDGIFLQVTPVVSADRRYVRMTLSPSFQTVTGLASFPVPAAVGGGGLGGGATSITGQIQLPETTNTTLSTTVTVPDGGTVLLGGVKRMREERREFGVPLLSKTPYIDRLFRNVGIGRRTDSLMLMVTPRIIILEEEEEKLGIPPAAR